MLFTSEQKVAAVSPTSPADAPHPASAWRPLLLDLAVPLGLYFLLHAGVGLGLVASLALSSIPPALREIWSIARDGRINALAALYLATNVAGIVASLVSGDARLMFARNSIISSVIAISMLVSVRRGAPIMSEGLKPVLLKGDDARALAWARLSSARGEFWALECRFTLVWRLCLLADCALRLAGAVLLPVSTMAWASDAILIGAIVLASVLGGVLCTRRMDTMLAV